LKACPDWAKNIMAQNFRNSLMAIVSVHKGWPKRNPADIHKFITHHGWPF
jgi:hypothetical protein